MDNNFGGVDFKRIISQIGLLLISIGIGIYAGLLFGVLGSFIYLIVLFPLVLGVGGGKYLVDGIKFTKVRNEKIIFLSGILLTISLYITLNYVRYIMLWGIMAFQEFGGLSDENLRAGQFVVEYGLEKATGYSGFIGYILFMAEQGVSIGRIFRSSSFNLGPIFTWIYWFVELGIIGFITIFMGKQTLKNRYCNICNSWYKHKKHVGAVSINKEPEILNLIKQKDFALLGASIEDYVKSPSIEFYLQDCESCDKNISYLSLSSFIYLNGKLASKDLLEVTLNPVEKKTFVGEIKTADA